ncbi:MAG: hypothetical protein ACREPR_16935 [Brasilonema sp.]
MGTIEQMIVNQVNSLDKLNSCSTEDLKAELLQLTQERDKDPISKKVRFYEAELAPIFEELSRRNPFPKAEEQIPLILGVWSPVWSTTPFHDIIPGRIREQSYQIFHDDGYYANIARYVPGNGRSFLQKLSSILLAYDLIVIQKFEVTNGQWFIQNVEIKQAFRLSGIPLDIDRAEGWFTKILQSNPKLSGQKADFLKAPELENLDKSTAKKLKTTFLTKPQFEHLYIDRDFRLVKTQREPKQRPSYIIAVRKQSSLAYRILVNETGDSKGLVLILCYNFW